jgi:hypothetical protein
MREMIDLDLSFPRSYEVAEPSELPGRGKLDVPVLYFPQATTRPEHDGLWLKVTPSNCSPWIGVSAFGYQSPTALSRVVSCPDPRRTCIVSRGAAYIVRTDQPEIWERIPVLPVVDLRVVLERELLIFSDFTQLAAYGGAGLLWQSPRVCWDELKIVRVTQDRIEGTGSDPISMGDAAFAVDLMTGCSLLPAPMSTDGLPVW